MSSREILPGTGKGTATRSVVVEGAPRSRPAPGPLDHAAHGPPPRSGEDQEGFTLIEMLVALAIFSLAALALLRLEGATVANMAKLQDQAFAQIVARNIAVETLTDPVAPAYGLAGGTQVNAGRNWSWTRLTAHSPDSRIQQITIHVQGQIGGSAANLVVFRRGAS